MKLQERMCCKAQKQTLENEAGNILLCCGFRVITTRNCINQAEVIMDVHCHSVINEGHWHMASKSCVCHAEHCQGSGPGPLNVIRLDSVKNIAQDAGTFICGSLP